MGWLGLNWIMLTDVVGTSVLSFASATAHLGWVPTVLAMTLGGLVAVYTGVLMSRTRLLLGNRGNTMGEIAGRTCGGQHAAKAVTLAVYGYAVLGQASYLLVLGKAFQVRSPMCCIYPMEHKMECIWNIINHV